MFNSSNKNGTSPRVTKDGYTMELIKRKGHPDRVKKVFVGKKSEKTIYDFVGNMGSAEKGVAAATTIERQMRKAQDWDIPFFEYTTNIPVHVKYIVYDVENKDDGIHFTIYQDGEGTTRELMQSKRTFNREGLSIEDVETRDTGDGSMFGIGMNNIDSHTLKFRFACRTDNGLFEVLDVHSGDYTAKTVDLKIDDKWKVVQSFVLPKLDSVNVSPEEKIRIFQKRIGLIDSKAIDAGSVHEFNVSGFSKELNSDLSGNVEAIKIPWKNKNSSGVPVPEFTSLFDNDNKPISEFTFSAPSNLSRDENITLYPTGLGLRSDHGDCWFDHTNISSNIGDQSWLFMYNKDGRNQLLGRVPTRNVRGKNHLNNVMLEAEVLKDEMRKFFTSPDKAKGFTDGFVLMCKNDKVGVQSVLENTYEDNDVREKGRQLFTYDIIVHDKYGDYVLKEDADTHREEQFHCGFLNDLPVSKRMELVQMEEWTNKSRIDIQIRVPKMYTEHKRHDEIIVIEMKRDGFNVMAVRQMTDYAFKVSNCVRIIGCATDITEGQYKGLSTELNAINSANQFRTDLDDLEGSLVDLNKNHFRYKTYELHYRSKVYDKLGK